LPAGHAGDPTSAAHRPTNAPKIGAGETCLRRIADGIQAVSGEDGRPIIPIISDADQVDANRKRIGQPPLAKAAAMSQATVVRIAEDGRLVSGGANAVMGLDGLDRRKAVTDPGWGLAEAGQAAATLPR
jgi:hypothetical protein